jgi:SAM-dependent methyltransferase
MKSFYKSVGGYSMKLTGHYSLIRQRFDRRAGQYARNPITHWIGHSELTALRNMIPAPSQPDKNTALDFGCGTGRVTAVLLELGYLVTGYDISPRMLDRARIALGASPHVTFTSNPQELRGSWPLIVSLGVLDYYPDSTPLWQEWRRLLSPGGILLVTAPNAHSPLTRLYVLLSRFTCQAYATTPEKLTSTARLAGFVDLGIQTVFPRREWGHTIVAGFQAQYP